MACAELCIGLDSSLHMEGIWLVSSALGGSVRIDVLTVEFCNQQGNKVTLLNIFKCTFEPVCKNVDAACQGHTCLTIQWKFNFVLKCKLHAISLMKEFLAHEKTLANSNPSPGFFSN